MTALTVDSPVAPSEARRVNRESFRRLLLLLILILIIVSVAIADDGDDDPCDDEPVRFSVVSEAQ